MSLLLYKRRVLRSNGTHNTLFIRYCIISRFSCRCYETPYYIMVTAAAIVKKHRVQCRGQRTAVADISLKRIRKWKSAQRHANTARCLWALSALHPYTKFEADCSICSKVIRGSLNFEIGLRDPGHAHLVVVLFSIRIPYHPSLYQIWSGLLNSFKSYKGGLEVRKLGHVTPATPIYF